MLLPGSLERLARAWEKYHTWKPSLLKRRPNSDNSMHKNRLHNSHSLCAIIVIVSTFNSTKFVPYHIVIKSQEEVHRYGSHRCMIELFASHIFANPQLDTLAPKKDKRVIKIGEDW